MGSRHIFPACGTDTGAESQKTVDSGSLLVTSLDVNEIIRCRTFSPALCRNKAVSKQGRRGNTT
jgi:hypothetical protein